MGTAIECFFPRVVERSQEAVNQALNELFFPPSVDLQWIAAHRGFAHPGEPHPWDFICFRREGEDQDEMWGEGPHGFDVRVYERVIQFGSSERYFALYDEERSRIVRPLRRVLSVVALKLGHAERIAVAASGFGDTDRASDLAFYQRAAFEEVCACLETQNGPPATTWDELARGEKRWYLGPPQDAP